MARSDPSIGKGHRLFLSVAPLSLKYSAAAWTFGNLPSNLAFSESLAPLLPIKGPTSAMNASARKENLSALAAYA